MRQLLITVVAVGALAATTGCSTSVGDAGIDVDVLTTDVAIYLEDLEQTGASQVQREAVLTALEAGEMSYATIEGLFMNYVACMEDAGFTVSHIGPAARHDGFSEPDARFYLPENVSEEQAWDLDRECYRRHYSAASGYYVSQPSSLDAYLESFETQREYILTCLDEKGIEVEEDATRLELLYAVSEASARFMDEPLCWRGSVFSEIHPPGVDPFEFYPPDLQEQIRQLEQEG